MKPKNLYFVTLMIIVLVLSACNQAIVPTGEQTDVPASQETKPEAVDTESETVPDGDVLYLNLLWHQHQPLYYKDEYGIYTRPWVRVHATKDYYDMAATVAKYPDVHVTFNITPVLIEQLNDFVNNGAKDQYWVLAEKPASELTEVEKIFILTRFFDANYDHIIRVHPGYKRLLDKRVGSTPEDIQNALTSFTEQDFRDLQIWFNLAWIDPDELAVDPLLALVTKDHDFSEEDKKVLFDEVVRITRQVLPIHQQLQENGQIEIITTPLAHPILPLIYNSNEAAVGNPGAELPKQYAYVQDAMAQLDASVQIYQETYGRAPKGLWPGEGAVSQDIVPLVGNAGYSWMASGEQVLASSLGIGSFTRDAADTVQEADLLYRPYFVSGAADGPIQGPEVMMVFRDTLLSDKLGFTYSQTPGKQAAADFMQRLSNIQAELKKEGATGPHLVSVILDGENAWENYQNDGKEFLNALYEELSTSTTVKTVTPSEYLAMFPEQQKLEKVFSGAWFSSNYDTWIGESEETAAWNYLYKVRKFLQDYELNRKQAPSPETLQQAFKYMYFAEGSDWFWWYGADQDSGNDAYFDLGFRQLLGKVYESLGEEIPNFVKVPIIPNAVAVTNQKFTGSFTPVIDGVANDAEWEKAAYYPFTGGAQARSEDVASGFYVGVDSKNLYLRIDGKYDWSTINQGVVGVYFSLPKGASVNATTRGSEAGTEPFLLGFGATNLVEIDLAANTGLFYTAAPSAWIQAQGELTSAVKDRILEIAVPLELFEDLQAGDELKLVAVVSEALRDLQAIPASGPAQLILPDLGNIETILEIEDPVGDDHGPGSYTYPTDAVFEKGVFDITRFKIGLSETDLIFTFTFNGEIKNPWNSGTNFSVQTLDVYVDKDPGSSTGARILLDGRNAAFAEGNGWEYAIWAEGWTPNIFIPDTTTLEAKEAGTISFKSIVDTATSSISLRVPLEVFGDGDPRTWGYAAMVLSQDGFPSPGVKRVRDVKALAEQWRVGGGSDTATNQTRILDLVWDNATSTQEEMLSGYMPTDSDVDTLDVTNFAQIQVIRIQ